MNSYEEKKQARIDRYRELSAKSAGESDSLVNESHKMLSAIPFGQPILVGHHSERADRNYRDRAGAKMERGIKAADKAAYYAQKAEAAENNSAISSDDPEAVAKLKEKAEALQAEQDDMKKANAYYRKHNTMKGCPGISDESAEKMDAKIGNAYSWNKQPFPSYLLQNNSANIRRIKERIKELESKSAITADDGWEFDGGRVEMNAEDNRIQIFFDSKPDENIRAELKSCGFRWAPSVGAWQRQLNGNGLYALKRVKSVQPA